MTPSHPDQINTYGNLVEFFRTALQHASTTLDISLAEHSEYYLVNLLHDFQRSERFFTKDGDRFEDTPLAQLLERALHSESLATRIRIFKRLGDTSLFVAGLFPDRARRRLVDLDYYIGMGSGAYQSLATMFGTQDVFTDIFAELGTKFGTCVDLLTHVRSSMGRSTARHDADLLEFYERWLRTGSKQLERVLIKAGIPTHGRPPTIT